jgi:ABC-2 type transport system ATP-binding protein
VRAADYARFTGELATIARQTDVSIHELIPADESLESVFQYLVRG